MKIKIYYHHTDCGGVVYYANYLNFLEEARTEFLAAKGVSIKDQAVDGTMFVVARQEIDYKYPAVYGDILEVATLISGTSGVRVNFEHEIKNQEGRLIVKAKTVLVCVGKDFKPKSIPEQVLQMMTR
ncbi:MAG: thioesterase family protein [Candidatus Omnitrophota bacterium]|nr:thioesterase family protein [Candidatus Omnitrophota bacterium]